MGQTISATHSRQAWIRAIRDSAATQRGPPRRIVRVENELGMRFGRTECVPPPACVHTARTLFRIARALRGRAMRKARGRIRGERSELRGYRTEKGADPVPYAECGIVKCEKSHDFGGAAVDDALARFDGAAGAGAEGGALFGIGQKVGNGGE